jgi:hypothetical protein
MRELGYEYFSFGRETLQAGGIASGGSD